MGEKYRLFDQLYHVAIENMVEMVRECRPILLRFVHLLGVEENKKDRYKLKGMVRYFGSQKIQQQFGFSKAFGQSFSTMTVAALEAAGKFDGIIRSEGLKKAEEDLDKFEAFFSKQYDTNLPYANEGKTQMRAVTQRWRIQLLKKHPYVNFNKDVWTPRGDPN